MTSNAPNVRNLRFAEWRGHRLLRHDGLWVGGRQYNSQALQSLRARIGGAGGGRLRLTVKCGAHDEEIHAYHPVLGKWISVPWAEPKGGR